MKGPSERLKYDLRRVWECPACHHRERTGGEVTYRLCACQRKIEPTQRVWMKLIHEGGRRGETPKVESANATQPSANDPPEDEFSPDEPNAAAQD